VALLGLIALRPPAGAGAGEAPEPCGLRIGEKLGVHFVEVCGADGASFWISVAPMPCSAGEHETIACPSVTPLLAWRAGTNPVALTARRAAMVDRVSAHRLCGLRFAGHVATRTELERARAARAVAAVIVSEPAAGTGEFRFDALPEWTADGACENPSAPGTRCRFARWPDAGARPATLAEVRACDARQIHTDEAPQTSVALGGRCPAPGWTWRGAADTAGRELPCGVRVPNSDARFALSCRAPAATPPAAPPDGGDIAGFRCVVPTWALATFQPVASD
jgi:hypothetical protein